MATRRALIDADQRVGAFRDSVEAGDLHFFPAPTSRQFGAAGHQQTLNHTLNALPRGIISPVLPYLYETRLLESKKRATQPPELEIGNGTINYSCTLAIMRKEHFGIGASCCGACLLHTAGRSSGVPEEGDNLTDRVSRGLAPILAKVKPTWSVHPASISIDRIA